MRRCFVATIMLAGALLAGCATLDDKDKSRDLTLDNYAAALRWGDFADAWQFVDPKVRAEHPLTDADKARYNAVQVAQYEANSPMQTGDGTIEQMAQMSLINKSSQSAYDVVTHEKWQWDPQTKHWWLESGFPDITPSQP